MAEDRNCAVRPGSEEAEETEMGVGPKDPAPHGLGWDNLHTSMSLY